MNGRVLLLTVLIHQWIWVNGQCPFPGLPPHGHGRAVDAAGEDLLWGRWRWFEPGQTVRYRCQPDRLVRPDSNATITCRDDGSWSDPVPLCGWSATALRVLVMSDKRKRFPWKHSSVAPGGSRIVGRRRSLRLAGSSGGWQRPTGSDRLQENSRLPMRSRIEAGR